VCGFYELVPFEVACMRGDMRAQELVATEVTPRSRAATAPRTKIYVREVALSS